MVAKLYFILYQIDFNKKLKRGDFCVSKCLSQTRNKQFFRVSEFPRKFGHVHPFVYTQASSETICNRKL